MTTYPPHGAHDHVKAIYHVTLIPLHELDVYLLSFEAYQLVPRRSFALWIGNT